MSSKVKIMKKINVCEEKWGKKEKEKKKERKEKKEKKGGKRRRNTFHLDFNGHNGASERGRRERD